MKMMTTPSKGMPRRRERLVVGPEQGNNSQAETMVEFTNCLCAFIICILPLSPLLIPGQLNKIKMT